MAGRDGELAVLLAAWDDVAAGGERTVLVEGDAGIGKTRLVDRFGHMVRQRGGKVLEAACLPLLDVAPYLPLLRVLETLAENSQPRWIPLQESTPVPDPTRRTRFFQQVADTTRATCAIGFPVSRTIRTAPSRKS